jgi:hypothetical protein
MSLGIEDALAYRVIPNREDDEGSHKYCVGTDLACLINNHWADPSLALAMTGRARRESWCVSLGAAASKPPIEVVSQFQRVGNPLGAQAKSLCSDFFACRAPGTVAKGIFVKSKERVYF